MSVNEELAEEQARLELSKVRARAVLLQGFWRTGAGAEFLTKLQELETYWVNKTLEEGAEKHDYNRGVVWALRDVMNIPEAYQTLAAHFDSTAERSQGDTRPPAVGQRRRT